MSYDPFHSYNPRVPNKSTSQEYFPSELSPEILSLVRHTISALQSLGATIIPISLPSTSYALSAYYVIASAEASSNMARYDGVQYGMFDLNFSQ